MPVCWSSGSISGRLQDLFARDGRTFVILLGGGTKVRQRKDVQDAQDRWQDYRRRTGEER